MDGWPLYWLSLRRALLVLLALSAAIGAVAIAASPEENESKRATVQQATAFMELLSVHQQAAATSRLCSSLDNADPFTRQMITNGLPGSGFGLLGEQYIPWAGLMDEFIVHDPTTRVRGIGVVMRMQATRSTEGCVDRLYANPPGRYRH
jgi:hypothetical protein